MLQFLFVCYPVLNAVTPWSKSYIQVWYQYIIIQIWPVKHVTSIMYCILLASMKASTLLLINVTVSTLSWACPCSSEDPWGLLAAPSSLFCHKTQSSLVTQGIFSFNFYVSFCIFKGYVYTYRSTFFVDKNREYPTKRGRKLWMFSILFLSLTHIF